MRRLLVGAKSVLRSVSRPASFQDVFCVDGMYGGLKEYASAYFLKDESGVIIVDPTTSFAVPRILGAMELEGAQPEDVSHIIVTHVHLDHAGGTGLLAQLCPQAKVLAHPKAARFLVDTTGIVAGATAVYGEKKVAELYGEVVPVPQDRICEQEDGSSLVLPSSRTLSFHHTLGHASHHMVIYDEKTRGCFTGDSFGMNYPKWGDGYMLPSTTPIDFDPSEAIKAVQDIVDLGTERAYLTHFGIWDDVTLGSDLNVFALEQYYDIVRQIPVRLDDDDDDNEAFVRSWLEDQYWGILESSLEQPRQVLEKDVPLSADAWLNAWGSYVYVMRRLKKQLPI